MFNRRGWSLTSPLARGPEVCGAGKIRSKQELPGSGLMELSKVPTRKAH